MIDNNMNNDTFLAKAISERFRRDRKYGNMYVRDCVLYDYGPHYPLAWFITPTLAVVNDKGYSVTTSKHIGSVRHQLSLAGCHIASLPFERGEIIRGLDELSQKIDSEAVKLDVRMSNLSMAAWRQRENVQKDMDKLNEYKKLIKII